MKQFSLNNMKQWSLFIAMFIIIAGCKKEEENVQNYMPKADFTITPERCEPNDEILFNAGTVTDQEDATDLLEVRWSWNSGSNYNTEYTTTKTASFKYNQVGVYYPRLEVRDSKMLSDTLRGMVVVVADIHNMSPEKPILLSPPEWQTWMDPTITFKWNAGIDPENDDQSFDLWIGRNLNSMKPVRSNIVNYIMIGGDEVYEVKIDGFEFNQDYYWQVRAKDQNGNYTLGHTWKFTTRPPDA